MARKQRTKLQNLVPHPRYGSAVRPSVTTIDPHTIRDSFYAYQRETIFPESAIPAEIHRQNYTVLPRPWYVDILKKCRDCSRNFLFFAEEQKHWYEDLHFTIDADCVRCPECRKTDRTLRTRFHRYSKSLPLKTLTNDQLAELLRDACFLYHHGLLQNPQKLRRLKNRAISQIPNHKATAEIILLVKTEIPPHNQS